MTQYTSFPFSFFDEIYAEIDLFTMRCSAATNARILRYAQDDDEKLETAVTPAGKRV
jgi:hypothetical protein